MAIAPHALLRGAVAAAILAVDAAASGQSAFAVQLEPMNKIHHRRRLSTIGAVTVDDCENVEYTGMIGLGTPIQEFRVALSIVSSHLWVVNTECMFCGSSSGGYNSSLSTTHEADGAHVVIPDPNGNTDAEGILSVDVLSMGGVSTAVTFAEMTEANLEGCTEVDGVIGMGLTNDDSSNAFEDMVEAGAVDVPIFSFFMGDVDTDSPSGVLTLGGVNQTHYEGCLEWIPISEAQEATSELPGSVPDGFWSVVLKDLKIGSDSVIRSEATAVLDTGSSLIEGPYDDVGALAKEIGAMCVSAPSSSASTAVFVDCVDDARMVELIVLECDADFGDINLVFGGKDFTLTARELLQPISDFDPVPNPSTAADPLCLFGMGGADMVDTWVLGDPFLRTFYTSYNVAEKTVGFAPATNSRTSPECAEDAGISSGPADADGEGGSSAGGEGGSSADGEGGSSAGGEGGSSADGEGGSSAGGEGGSSAGGEGGSSAGGEGGSSASGEGGSSADGEGGSSAGGEGGSSAAGEGGSSAGGEGGSSADGEELGGASAAETGGGGSSGGGGGGGEAEASGDEEQTSVVAIGVAAGLGTMALVSCAAVVFVVQQRLKRTRQGGGAYRPAVDEIGGGGDGGGGGGGFEMSSGGKGSLSMAARHGGEAVEQEEDFLQAPPRAGVAHGSGGAGNATARVLGRLLGETPARAGFAAFENAD